ncbi:hypothetical protein BC830DRAFT_1077156 [Chytriomyces sp. MP71]|nr:hypothetical protein BC830DRAFT_1077156 [Chytriomyces sp. MP71]
MQAPSVPGFYVPVRKASLSPFLSHYDYETRQDGDAVAQEFDLLEQQIATDNERRLRGKNARMESTFVQQMHVQHFQSHGLVGIQVPLHADTTMARVGSAAELRRAGRARTGSNASAPLFQAKPQLDIFTTSRTSVDTRHMRRSDFSGFSTTNPAFLCDEALELPLEVVNRPYSQTSDAYLSRRPSTDTIATETSAPSLKMCSSSRSYSQHSPRQRSSRVSIPSIFPASAKNPLSQNIEHYPSLMAPLAAVLMSSAVIHGSLQRSTIHNIQSRPSSPSRPPSGTGSSSKLLTSSKAINFLAKFCKSTKSTHFVASPAAEASPSATPHTPSAQAAADSARGRLTSCVLALLGNRVYVYDVPHNATRRARSGLEGPLTQDFSSAEWGVKCSSRLTASSRKTSFSSQASFGSRSAPPRYAGAMMEARPRVVVQITNVCVAEDGIWMLRLSGLDLSKGGVEGVDLFLQARECEEMSLSASASLGKTCFAEGVIEIETRRVQSPPSTALAATFPPPSPSPSLPSHTEPHARSFPPLGLRYPYPVCFRLEQRTQSSASAASSERATGAQSRGRSTNNSQSAAFDSSQDSDAFQASSSPAPPTDVPTKSNNASIRPRRKTVKPLLVPSGPEPKKVRRPRPNQAVLPITPRTGILTPYPYKRLSVNESYRKATFEVDVNLLKLTCCLKTFCLPDFLVHNDIVHLGAPTDFADSSLSTTVISNSVFRKRLGIVQSAERRRSLTADAELQIANSPTHKFCGDVPLTCTTSLTFSNEDEGDRDSLYGDLDSVCSSPKALPSKIASHSADTFYSMPTVSPSRTAILLGSAGLGQEICAVNDLYTCPQSPSQPLVNNSCTFSVENISERYRSDRFLLAEVCSEPAPVKLVQHQPAYEYPSFETSSLYSTSTVRTMQPASTSRRTSCISLVSSFSVVSNVISTPGSASTDPRSSGRKSRPMKGATGGLANSSTVYRGPPSSSGRKKRSQASELKMAVVTAAADALRLERMQSGAMVEDDDDDERPMATPVLARGAMSAVLVGSAEKMFPMIPLATQAIEPTVGSRKGGMKRKAGKSNMDPDGLEGCADSGGADAIDTADDDDATPLLLPKKKARTAPRKRKTKALTPAALDRIEAPMTLSTEISGAAPLAIEPAPLSVVAMQAQPLDLAQLLPPPLMALSVTVPKVAVVCPTASDIVPIVSVLNDITPDIAGASNEGTFARMTKFSHESTCVDGFAGVTPSLKVEDPDSCMALDFVMKLVDPKPDTLVFPLSLMECHPGLQQVDQDITFEYVDIQDEDADGSIVYNEPSFFNPEPSQRTLDDALDMDWSSYFSVTESLELMQGPTSIDLDPLGTAFLTDAPMENATGPSGTYMDPTMDGFFDLQMYDDNLMRSNSGPSHSFENTSDSFNAITHNFQQLSADHCHAQPLVGFLFGDNDPPAVPMVVAMCEFSSTTETTGPVDVPASSSKSETTKFPCTVPGCSKVYASQHSLR